MKCLDIWSLGCTIFIFSSLLGKYLLKIVLYKIKYLQCFFRKYNRFSFVKHEIFFFFPRICCCEYNIQKKVSIDLLTIIQQYSTGIVGIYVWLNFLGFPYDIKLHFFLLFRDHIPLQNATGMNILKEALLPCLEQINWYDSVVF